ncbi:hypothetical protein EU244_030870 [Rhodococcus qingshengii]|uniref:hypothetical protein n=1 Tax=Rhodococcus qingshengii TaxID=334542 RepID=UPI0014561D79|nr:hypothetical protein [Rhodococcus qingshengii]
MEDLSDERPDFEVELAAGCAQRFDEYCRDQGSYEAMYADRGALVPKGTGTKS